VTESITYRWNIQQLLGQMDRSGTEDACQFTASVILSNLQVVKEGFLIHVSKPHLRCVGKNREDNADEDPPP
jgi:hypothetical protein